MTVKPMQFENAEACLRLTLVSLGKLSQQDRDYIEHCMRLYGDLRHNEAIEEIERGTP